MHATGATHRQAGSGSSNIHNSNCCCCCSCCKLLPHTPYKRLLGLRTMDCDSECNRFWAGRGSLLTYIGRNAHRFPLQPAPLSVPFRLCSNLTNLYAPENSNQVGRVESCDGLPWIAYWIWKSWTGQWRGERRQAGRLARSGSNWNGCIWLEGKQCRLMGAFQLNSLVFTNWMSSDWGCSSSLNSSPKKAVCL